MTYLLDTNIVLNYLRETRYRDFIETNYELLHPSNTCILSVVSVGELRSLALQNNWGIRRMNTLETFLSRYVILDINVESVINQYAVIDAYSQGRLSGKRLPRGMSARNMGKNDLWLAASASVLNVPLMSIDRDFEHLDGVFLDFIYVDVSGI